MPQLTRHYCSRCQQSIYNCVIDGVRVPLVVYFAAGQPEDSGPTLALNDPGVKVPSFLRALMSLPIPRIELCVRCLAEVFALPLLDAVDDPMGLADGDGNGIPDLLERTNGLGAVPQMAVVSAPVYDAIRAGHTAAFEFGARAALAAAGVVDPAVINAAVASAVTIARTAITVGGPTAPVGDGPNEGLPALSPAPPVDVAAAGPS